MPMTRVGIDTKDDEARRPALVTEIARLWDELAGHLEHGRCSEAQLATIVRDEPDPDAPTLILTLWAGRLRRAVAAPGNIGVDWDALNPSAHCQCGDTGWVHDTTTDKPGMRPCERCNVIQYRLWHDHWRITGHSCDECSGARRRRQSPTGERDDRAEDTEALYTQHQQDTMDGLR